MSCKNPFLRYNKVTHSYDRIPCGWCVSCRIDKRTYYTDKFEYSLYKDFNGVGSFTCITYDDNHIPFNDSKTEFTLRFSDSVNFIKRIRSYMKYHKINSPFLNPNFKFFAVGEYGGQFNRPHMHYIFTGLDYSAVSQLFHECWKNGVIIDNRPILKGGIGYCLKYVLKQEHGQALSVYEKKGIEPPFFHCSHCVSKGLYVSDNQFYTWHNKQRPLPIWIRRKRLLPPSNVLNDQVKLFAFKNNISYDDADLYLRKVKLNALQNSAHFNNEPCFGVDIDTLKHIPKSLEFRSY